MSDLPTILAHIAAVVAGVSTVSGCQGDDSCAARSKDIDVLGSVGCEIANQGGIYDWSTSADFLSGPVCDQACGSGFGACFLTDDYIRAYRAAQPIAYGDASLGPPSSDAAPDATSPPPPECQRAQTWVFVDGGWVRCAPPPPPVCPGGIGTVKVKCSQVCEGRRTEGFREPSLGSQASAGTYFAACSYLEAVSVLAFARLRAELEAHGAPAALISAVRCAELDEVRHVQLTACLARRFGVEPDYPGAAPSGIRSLVEIARENAIEGCVRETYGAALALVRVARARDSHVRTISCQIAHDECQHAALSWRIAAWAAPRLDERERAEVGRALRDAVAELKADPDDELSTDCRALSGMPARDERRRLVALLDEVVFRVLKVEDAGQRTTNEQEASDRQPTVRAGNRRAHLPRQERSKPGNRLHAGALRSRTTGSAAAAIAAERRRSAIGNRGPFRSRPPTGRPL